MDLMALAGGFAPMLAMFKQKTGLVEREIHTDAEREFHLSGLHDYAFSPGAENHVIEFPDVKGYEIRAFISARKKGAPGPAPPVEKKA